eukprot:scaffold65389_cov35-Tisochrysis_lutea.AAC.2
MQLAQGETRAFHAPFLGVHICLVLSLDRTPIVVAGLAQSLKERILLRGVGKESLRQVLSQEEQYLQRAFGELDGPFLATKEVCVDLPWQPQERANA